VAKRARRAAQRTSGPYCPAHLDGYDAAVGGVLARLVVVVEDLGRRRVLRALAFDHLGRGGGGGCCACLGGFLELAASDAAAVLHALLLWNSEILSDAIKSAAAGSIEADCRCVEKRWRRLQQSSVCAGAAALLLPSFCRCAAQSACCCAFCNLGAVC